VVDKERKTFSTDLKAIYQAPMEEKSIGGPGASYRKKVIKIS
jgi:hypothetical protein